MVMEIMVGDMQHINNLRDLVNWPALILALASLDALLGQDVASFSLSLTHCALPRLEEQPRRPVLRPLKVHTFGSLQYRPIGDLEI